jgi:hypothetical protein
MGWIISLEGERGDHIEKLGDPHRMFLHLLKKVDKTATSCLRFIDPYGNTIFNRLQMSQLITELEILNKAAENPEQNNFIKELKDLAQRCAEEPHLYLKIIGE